MFKQTVTNLSERDFRKSGKGYLSCFFCAAVKQTEEICRDVPDSLADEPCFLSLSPSVLQKRAEGSCSEVTAGSGFGSQCLLLSVNKVQLFLSKCYIQMLKNRLLYSYTGSVIG